MTTNESLDAPTYFSSDSVSSIELGDLANVDLTGISANQTIAYSLGLGKWIPSTIADTGTVTQINTGSGLTGGPIVNEGTISLNANLEDLNNLDISGLSDGDVLVYSSGTWVSQAVPIDAITSIATGTGLTGGPITSTGTISLDASLNDLSDVDTTGVSNGETIVYSGGSWSSGAIPTGGVSSIATGTGLTGGTITTTGTISLSAALSDLSNVDTTGVSDGDLLTYVIGDGEWQAGIPSTLVKSDGSNVGSVTIGTSTNYSVNFAVNNSNVMTLSTSSITASNKLLIGAGTAEANLALKITSDDVIAESGGIGLATTDTASSCGFYLADNASIFGGNTDAHFIFYGSTHSSYPDTLEIASTDGSINIVNEGTTSANTIDFYSNFTLKLRLENNGTLRPGSNNSYSLGTSSNKWSEVWATDGTINTSDRNMKDLIVESDLGLDFINMLVPVSYKWRDYNVEVDGEVIEKKFTRTHYGLIAQEVKSSIKSLGKTTKDFAGYVESSDGCGLRYTEFISPIIKSIQDLNAIADNMISRIATIEQRQNRVIINAQKTHDYQKINEFMIALKNSRQS